MDDIQTLDNKWERMLQGERPTFYVSSNKDLCELKRRLYAKGLGGWIREGEGADVRCDLVMCKTGDKEA